MKKLSFIIASLIASSVYAATDAEIEAAKIEAVNAATEAARAQEEQRLDAQKQQLAEPKKPSGLDLDSLRQPTPELAVPAGECYELDKLTVSGARVLDEWDLEVLEAPFIGECITPSLATAVLAKTTDYYITRGFITTRAYLPNQDLKDGVLEVFIAEGQVEETIVQADKPLYIANAFQPDPDIALNIRDLEQAVDQFNAVPGNDVKMAVQPGESPMSSQVVFENKGEPELKGRLSTDNSGSEATGERGVTLSVQAGDLLKANDVWSLSVRKSLGNKEKSSRSVSLDVKIPHGYNTYAAGYTDGGFKTLLTFPVTGTELSSEGANESAYVSASRVVFRDQDSKHSTTLKLKRDSVESYIADTKIDVSSRSLTSLLFSTESVLGFGQNVLIVSPEIAMGLDEVDNLPVGVNTPVENPQSEYLRYKLTANWLQPFTLGEESLRWSSRLVGQYADAPLYGSQQLVVGGAASVRGSHFTSIVGDRGYFWQNSINLYKNHTLGKSTINGDYMIGYDVGRVWSERPDVYEGAMDAIVLGATWVNAPFNLSLTHSVPVNIDGDLDKGDTFTKASIGLDF